MGNLWQLLVKRTLHLGDSALKFQPARDMKRCEGQQLLQHWAAKAEGTVPHTDAKAGPALSCSLVLFSPDTSGCPRCFGACTGAGEGRVREPH